MKKLLLTLITAFAFCGSIFAQAYTSYWADDFDIYHNNPYDDHSDVIAFIQIDDQFVQFGDLDWEWNDAPNIQALEGPLEVGCFVGETCRGHYFVENHDEDYGDPMPAVAILIYYTTQGEEVTFKMYDHANNILYNGCTVLYLEEDGETLSPYTVVTGVDNYDQWDYNFFGVTLNFTSPMTITASANPAEGGTVSGAGNYNNGDTATLTATANPGYYFLNWTENDSVVSSDAEYSFVVTESRDLVANFFTNHWTAENYTNDMFMIGVVQIDGIEQTSPSLELGAFCDGECRGSEFPVYDEGQWLYFMNIGGNTGDEITFRLYDHALQQELNLYCFNLIPFEIYGLIGIEEPYEVQFASIYTISANVSPESAGTVTGTGEYLVGTDVTLTATANEGYSFNNWTLDGEVVSTESSYSFTVTNTMNFIANFKVWYSVSATVSPDNAGTITGTGEYLYGTDVTLTATPNEGYAFNSWTLDGEVVSTDPSYTFTVTAPVSLTANFDVLYSVSINVNPENAGTIEGEGEYPSGAEATLTATANEGFVFNSWTLDGEIVSTEPSYTFTVTSEMNFIANFDALYSVSATVNLEDAGAIIGMGIYVSGTEATLIATPYEGYVFNSWTLDGEVVSTEPAYTFTVTEPVDLVANFNLVYTQQLGGAWNWWSTYLDITLDDLKAALLEASPNTTITIKSRTQSTKYVVRTHTWNGTLNWDIAQMYKILVPDACEITLEGLPVNPAEHPITVSDGANWIGYPLSQNMSVNNALAGFPAVNNDIIKSKTNVTIYTRGSWKGGLSTFEPGQGYIFKSAATGNRTLVFPSGAK